MLLLAATSGLAQEQPAILPPLQPVTPEMQAPAANAPESAVTTVHGVVRNAATGEPLPRALVRIEGDAETGTLTDSEGRFELPGVPVGPQMIQIRKPGFHDRPYASEDVGYQGDGPAHNVLLVAEMPDLDFALSPISAIRGRVELSTGDPGQGITLTLLKQMVRNGRAVWAQNGTAKTNGDGAYRFANLPAGVYALYTQPTLESEPAVAVSAPGAKIVREGYASVFYPGVREFSGATHIRLRAGQQSEANLLLTPEPFYTVTATAILPNGKPYTGNSASDGAQLSAIMVLDSADRETGFGKRFDQVTRTFQTNLPDGIYTFLVRAELGKTNFQGQFDPGGRNGEHTPLTGLAEFSVDGHPVTNLTMPLAIAPSWPIHLHAVRTNAHANSNPSEELQNLVTVTATDAVEAPADGTSAEARAGYAGSSDLLELNPVRIGPNWISTEVNDRSLCVDSFTAGGINLAREPLNVALGASPPPMELTLRDDCAKLALTLPPALSEFLPGDEPFYTVYVVPDFDTTADIPPMNMHPSSGTTLTVDGLTPGNYHVYVFDRPVRLEYRNLEVIAALPKPGQAVTLTAGSTSNLVLEVPER